jgi:hypothetical protein
VIIEWPTEGHDFMRLCYGYDFTRHNTALSGQFFSLPRLLMGAIGWLFCLGRIALLPWAAAGMPLVWMAFTLVGPKTRRVGLIDCQFGPNGSWETRILFGREYCFEWRVERHQLLVIVRSHSSLDWNRSYLDYPKSWAQTCHGFKYWIVRVKIASLENGRTK